MNAKASFSRKIFGSLFARCSEANWRSRLAVCLHPQQHGLVVGSAVARTLNADQSNRPQTARAQLQVLIHDELFVFNAMVPASFDSWFFGPIDSSFVRGRATRLASISSQ